MSNPDDSADKPVVKEKDPHNYRKVGFSMIVISVSLVAIGLLVWAIGDNYHFSSDIMAAQEIDAMTPKSGYAVVVFDYTQPIGAKLKLVENTNDLSEAQKTQADEAQKYIGQQPQALIFDSSKQNNTNSVALSEVYALTPNDGYRIVSFNTALPVGARLSSLKMDDQYTNATSDVQFYSSQITDPAIHIIIFGTTFEDNVKQVLGDKYTPDIIENNLNKFTQKPHIAKPVVTPPPVVTTNATQTTNQTTAPVITSPPVTNQTVTVPTMTNATQATNQTVVATIAPTNSTNTTNQTATSSNSTQINLITNSTKTVNLSENISINSTGH
ncbi:MAG: hypothetical protein ABI340_01245 [Nitrososphaera sp.]